jgi:hypothetical protein
MSPHDLTPDIIRKAEALIGRIKGISSCKISLDESGEIAEIHVVASVDKPAKLIARDVESCLKAELGIEVDHRKIGVVLVDMAGSPSQESSAVVSKDEEQRILEFPVEEHPSRFAFQSVNLFISEHAVKAEVELTRDAHEAFGSAQRERGPSSNWHAIAEATLRAVSDSLDESTRLCLCDVLQILLGDKNAVVVRVDLVRGRERKSLAGCAIMSGDEAQTVVYATLDAINRMMGKLKPKSSIEYKIQ